MAGEWQFFHGDIAEVLVYERAALSEGDVGAISQYLHDKWQARVAHPSVGWTRVGGLGATPQHLRQDLPLSDQTNVGKWQLVRAFSDEFDAKELNKNKWHLAWTEEGDWQGRQPAWFDPQNVSVKDGMLNLVFRKSDVPQRLQGQGYHGYSSAFVRTKERNGYGYYEIRARAMNSAGSSSFWFTDTPKPENATEIDVFELGGNSKDFDHKYNMNAHVWATPKSKEHWAVGGVWVAPWRFADGFHVYGFDWSKEELVWYVDGVVVRRMKNTNWFYPMRLVFDSEAMWDWFGRVNDADLPSTFQIDYVRCWRKTAR
jgi:beta-glucanase (GH16 family)